MKPLPMPLRIAAGLVATAIEGAQELPRKLIELPVTAVSQALQATMRVQQRITELAIRGDRALGALRPVPETPAWARFDEDEEALSFSGANVFSGPDGFRGSGGFNGSGAGSAVYDWPDPPPPRAVRRVVSPIPITRDCDDEPVERDHRHRDRDDQRLDDQDLDDQALDDEDLDDEELGDEDLDEQGLDDEGHGAHAVFDEDGYEGPAATASAALGGRDNPPPGLEGYDSWTLPQLRGRFRALTLAQVRALLDWETSHQDRPPYVTMLSNRLASITGR